MRDFEALNAGWVLMPSALMALDGLYAAAHQFFGKWSIEVRPAETT